MLDETMEKTKKLSLKRKTISKQNIVNHSAPILLDNETDEVISTKTATVLNSEAVEGNTSLGKLKNLLLRISSKNAVPGSFIPFPEYNPKLDHTKCFHQRDTTTHGPENAIKQEFYPFPKLCRHYKLHRQNLKQSENAVISNNAADFWSSQKNVVNSEQKHLPVKGKMDSNEFPEENCLILRDRNSNLYSLQTKNHLLTASRTYNTYEAISVRLKNDNPEIKDRKVSHEDSRNPVLSGKQLPNHFKRHRAESLDLGIAHSSTSVVTCNDYKKRSHAIEKTHRLPATVAQSPVSTDHSSVDNFHQRDTNTQVSININTQEFFPLPKLDDQEAQSTSSKANKERAIVARDETAASSAKQTTLTSCPLCQHEFDPRFGQVEQDSHIAQCLSMSDDVVW
ncbi:uncharacterized protein LOC127881178 isoform X2 [Dreissena polymorpha]|uniref:uncharacterized protein LOC127881178 isoform X2 n=1 Tax=Dreissena polymorpha TaxID=45954 RepID=UPI002264756A|nr:uncharacterized protein LOC127881178 isoform X2 [Dreissena polymorpha]